MGTFNLLLNLGYVCIHILKSKKKANPAFIEF